MSEEKIQKYQWVVDRTLRFRTAAPLDAKKPSRGWVFWSAVPVISIISALEAYFCYNSKSWQN